MDGANTVAKMFSTFAYSACDEFQADRFINCMGEWEAATDQGSFGILTSKSKFNICALRPGFTKKYRI